MPVFNIQHTATWPSIPKAGEDNCAVTWPASTASVSGGVLTFNGSTSGHNSVTLGRTGGQHCDGPLAEQWNRRRHGDLFRRQPGGLQRNRGQDTLIAGNAFDIPISATVGGGNNLLEGGAANDSLTVATGGPGGDTLMGGAGNETIQAGSGSDTIVSGDGNDTILGYDGSASSSVEIDAGSGNDTIYGGSGNFTINAGSGSNATYGQTGYGTVNGGSGKDVIDCRQCNPAKATLINGGSGSDTIYGGAGSDTIYGGTRGDNYIVGASTAAGTALIFGGGNGDTLCAGRAPPRSTADRGRRRCMAATARICNSTPWARAWWMPRAMASPPATTC